MLIPPSPTRKLPILISYHYMRSWKDEWIDYILSNPRVEILLDSGAFSALNVGATVELSEYMEFLDRWKDKLFGYMLLDKLGDPVTTAANYNTMLDHGLEPIPIHVRGDDGDRMDELFETSGYVALGGLRRPRVGWAPKSYVKQKMEWAAGRPVHWLGYTRQDMLPYFMPYSCDSSNNISAAQYGRLMVCNGMRLQSLSTRELLTKPMTVGLQSAMEAVGATKADLLDKRSWRSMKRSGQRTKEFLTAQITMFTYVKYALTWSDHGVRVFLATVGAYDGIRHFFDYNNQLQEGYDDYPVPDEVSDPPRSVLEWFHE